MSIKHSFKQPFNGLLIILGGTLSIYAFVVPGVLIYFKIIGLIFLMVGAYRASKHWVSHKDDHLDQKEKGDKDAAV